MTKWQTDGVIRRRTVDGYEVEAIAVGSSNSARSVALVYAGFGDGPEVAQLITAAPRMLATLERIVAIAEAGVNRAGMSASTLRTADLKAILATAIAELALSSKGQK